MLNKGAYDIRIATTVFESKNILSDHWTFYINLRGWVYLILTWMWLKRILVHTVAQNEVEIEKDRKNSGNPIWRKGRKEVKRNKRKINIKPWYNILSTILKFDTIYCQQF